MRYNSFLHIFPEQCAKYLHDKFKMHSDLTVRELMVILKHMGIKTVKVHDSGKAYDVFYKRIIDGVQDFEFLNNLHEYRRIKQIRDEWSKESPENYDPELSNMQNASDELLRQDDVYYTNEALKHFSKKRLYESIMYSIAKEVKKVLNEEIIDNSEKYKNVENYSFYDAIIKCIIKIFEDTKNNYNSVFIKNVCVSGISTMTKHNVGQMFSTGHVSGLTIESALIDALKLITKDNVSFKFKQTNDNQPVHDLKLLYNKKEYKIQIKALDYKNLKDKTQEQKFAMNDAIREGNHLGIVIIYEFQNGEENSKNVILKEIHLYVPNKNGKFNSKTYLNRKRLVLDDKKSLVVIK